MHQEGRKGLCYAQHIISRTDHKIVIRNFEGNVSVYTEPKYIQEECNCPDCQSTKLEGIAQLLQDNENKITLENE